MDQQQRLKMIEESAYYRSLSAGANANPMDDWLEAEKEINRKFPPTPQGINDQEELAAFERLRQEMNKALTAMKGSLTKDSFRQAVDKAVREVKELGEFTSESVNKAAMALRKDTARNIDRLQGAWHSVTLKTAGIFSAWSRRGAKFLKQAEEVSSTWLQENHLTIMPHTYHTGEISTAGTFLCQSCGHSLKLEQTGHLPRCPHCESTSFSLQS